MYKINKMSVESIGTFPVCDNYILFGLRCEKSTFKLEWDWIGGRMEESDLTPFDCYKREVTEECGSSAADIIIENTSTLYYTVLENPLTEKQIWILHSLLPSRDECNKALSEEKPIIPNTSYHISYKWMTKDEVLSLLNGEPQYGHHARGFIMRIKEDLIEHLLL